MITVRLIGETDDDDVIAELDRVVELPCLPPVGAHFSVVLQDPDGEWCQTTGVVSRIDFFVNKYGRADAPTVNLMGV